MAQASTLKSVQITNLDSQPIVPTQTGESAPADLRTLTGVVAALTGDTTASVYKMVRIPTNAKVKHVWVYGEVATAGSADLNVAFSDSTTDGTPVSLQGTIPQVASANNKLFGAAQSLVLAGVNTEFTYANTFTPTMSNEELWKALGYTDDPGGFFDLQFNVTTAVTTGGTVALEVQYAE